MIQPTYRLPVDCHCFSSLFYHSQFTVAVTVSLCAVIVSYWHAVSENSIPVAPHHYAWIAAVTNCSQFIVACNTLENIAAVIALPLALLYCLCCACCCHATAVQLAVTGGWYCYKKNLFSWCHHSCNAATAAAMHPGTTLQWCCYHCLLWLSGSVIASQLIYLSLHLFPVDSCNCFQW